MMNKIFKKKKSIIAVLASVMCCCIGLLCITSIWQVNAEQLSGRWIKTPSVSTTINDGDFSVVVMGDQQIVLSNYSKYLAYSYDYIVENKDEMNLKMFINLGDIFDVVDFTDDIGGYNAGDEYGRNRGNDPDTKYWFQQKQYVSDQVQKLENADIPVALTMGNHDYEDMAFNYRINKTFDEAFPLSRFESKDYFGGAQYEDIEQAYYYFEGNGQKYMVLVLGLFPSDEMIEWANRVVSENTDCKVIVTTHGYFDRTGRAVPRADYLWTNFLSLHENIFLLLCGHDWDDGKIETQVDYGVHGNPVYQFMINSQGEEFGGMGLFAQLIFRTDGTVDCAYYAPSVEKYATELRAQATTGMYFMSDNQFTFDLNVSKIEAFENGKVVVGKSFNGSSLFENYVVCKSTNGRWLRNVYDYNNVSVTEGKGLYTDSEGYITYKISAGEYSRTNGLTFMPVCKLGESVATAFQVDVSFDYMTWKTALYQDGVTGKSNFEFDLSRSVAGAKDLYVRVLLRGDGNFNMISVRVNVKTVETVLNAEEDNFSVVFDVATATADNYDEKMYTHLDSDLTRGQLLGAGGSGYLGGKAFLTYRFDAPKNKALKTLNFAAVMKIDKIPREYSFAERTFDYGNTGTETTYSEAQTFGFKEKDSELALRILVSYDEGLTFKELITYNNADYAGNAVRFDYDIPVESQSSVIVKLQYFGANVSDVGFTRIEFNGSYLSGGYVLNGGVIYGDYLRPVKDGYVFDGWYVNGEKTDNPESYENSGVSIEARWKKIVSVYYITNGVKNVAENKSVLIEGEELLLTDLQLQGKTFAGWYDISGNRYSSVTANTEDVILYAVFY